MDGWKKVKIGDFLFEREGRYKPDAAEIEGLKRVDKIDFSGNFYIANKPGKSSKTDMILVKPGDLVISGINVAKGALGVYDGAEDVTATIHYSSYTFNKDKINVEYFKRFLKSPLFIQLLKEQVKGGIKTEIKPKHLLPLEIILPSKSERQSILNRFLTIENEDSELKFELAHQKTLLRKLRKQILQEAVQGKLTADWRAQHPDAEPARDLLKRIASEKAQLVKDFKIRAWGPLPPISKKESPFVKPEGWEWCRLGELLTSIQYGTSKKCSYDRSDGTPILRIPNVSSGVLSSKDMKYTNLSNKEKIQYSLREGDLLIIRSNGSRELVGRSVHVSEKFVNHGFAGYLIRLRFFTSMLNSKFIQIYLSSPFIRSSIEDPLRTTVGINNINSTEISSLAICLPSLDEQQIILSKVDKCMSLCDQLEARINQNENHAEQLMQAVLKEAFSHKEGHKEGHKGHGVRLRRPG